jgi:hypothetical protein
MLIGTGADNVIIDGYAGYTGLVNTHCNTYIVRFDGCYNSVARNIGTRLTPYDHGSVNPSAYSFFTTVIKNCKIQRCYTQNASTAFHLGANSATEVYIENCGGDYADAMTTAANVAANTHVKNLGAASWGGGTGTPGTHFHNIFVSATSGNLGVAFNEPSVDSLSYVNFIPYSTTAMTGWSRTGTLNMRERYDEITYTWPYKIIGVTGFYNSDLVLVGTNTANHTCMYAIKKAGEESYSAWKAATGANLSAETISAVSGFWLKLNIACNTSSATNALTRAYINTLTSATDQDIYYPLDSYTLSFTGLEKSSKIAIVSSGSENLLELLTSSGGVASYTYGDTDVGMYIDAAILTSGYYYQKLSEYQLTSEDVSIPISQEPDLVYSPTMASGIYFAFSGINHRIYGNSGLVSDGQFEFDIQNIYSEWIAWAMTGNNLKYLPAFDATGGDNIGGGQSVGKYVFMNNNTWKFVAPNVTPLDVIVNGSLYGANSDASLIEMIGGNTTSLQIRNSALTVGINTAGSTLTAADVWEHTIENTLTAEQIQRVLLAVAAGITSIEDLGGGTANVRFYGQDETTVRVSGYMTGSERDTMNLNGA